MADFVKRNGRAERGRKSFYDPSSAILAFMPLAIIFFLVGLYALSFFFILFFAAVLFIFRERLWENRFESSMLLFAVPGVAAVVFLLLPLVNIFAAADPSKLIAVLGDATVIKALTVSLEAAIWATAFALLLGVPFAYFMARKNFPGRAMLEGVIDLPIVVPDIVAGIALLTVFGRMGLVGSGLSGLGMQIADAFPGIVLAMFFVSAPFTINHALEAFRKVDPKLESVARTLGSSRVGAFLRITLPLSWRGLISGAIMTWARAVSQFGAVVVIAYYPKVTTVLIYERYSTFGLQAALPVAVLLTVICLSFFIILRAAVNVRRGEYDQD
jgi:molybdate/tungstate transport system permease protein